MISRNVIFTAVIIVLSFGTFVSFFTSWTTTSLHHQQVVSKNNRKVSTNQRLVTEEDTEETTKQSKVRKSRRKKPIITSSTPIENQDEKMEHDQEQQKEHDDVKSSESHKGCRNFVDHPKCKRKLLSSPKYSDFPEYRWPNQSSLLSESPVLSLSSVSARIDEEDDLDFAFDENYVNRQLRNLQCFYDGEYTGEEKRQEEEEKTTVRIYVPWKNFTYMTPYPFRCPNSKIDCQVTNKKSDLVSKDDDHHSVDGYLVDSNGAYVNEVYDWVRNPARFVLIAYNTENIEGRREALKKGYGLRYLAKPWNSTWWSFLHMTASYQRHSQIFVSFFHWSLCRDESFLRGYRHWERLKIPSIEKALKNATKRNRGNEIEKFQNLLDFVSDEKAKLAESTKKSDNNNPSSSMLFHPILRGKLDAKLTDPQNAPILFFVRNCDFASHRRSGFMVRLQKYIPINSVGKCHINRHPKSITACDGMKGNRRSCMIAEYRFYLCIENSISLDYVSEKIYEPMLVGTIPIYLGAPNVADFLPTKHSAILAQDFTSLKQLANYVNCISKNKTLYEYYTHWWKRPLLPAFKRIVSKPYAPLCEACERIAKLKKKYEGDKEQMIRHFERESTSKKKRREPGVSGDYWDYGVNSQAPLKECLKDE